MLIQLDESLVVNLPRFKEKEWDALSNLAVAALEGNHFLVAPTSLSKLLLNEKRLSQREQSLFRDLNARHFTTAGMADLVDIRVLVVWSSVFERKQSEDKEDIILPLSFFSFSESTRPSVLLCENTSDCKLVRELAEVFAHNTKTFRSVKIKFDNQSGGGGSTHTIANEFLCKNRFLITVVDSDRSTPTGALGSTAKNVKGAFVDANSITSEIVILKARELENLLPDAFYRAEFRNDPDHQNSIAFLTCLEDVGCEDARLHVDIKKGLTLKQILVTEGNPPDIGNVWNPLLERLANEGDPVNPEIRRCANARQCACPQECRCVLMKSNGSNLLSRGTAKWRMNRNELWRDLPQYLKQPISELSRRILAWGCAQPQKRT